MEGLLYRLVDGASEYIGTADELITRAMEGYVPKQALASLLTADARKSYLESCAAIEKRYTEECTATRDPCLESGCAAEDEICLQPLLRADDAYHKACGAEWVKFFADPRNREV